MSKCQQHVWSSGRPVCMHCQLAMGAALEQAERARAKHQPVKDGLVTYECRWHQEQQKTLGEWMALRAQLTQAEEYIRHLEGHVGPVS